MSRSRHTEAQMIGALRQVEAGRAVEDVAREVGVSKHTLYAWKAGCPRFAPWCWALTWATLYPGLRAV